MEKKRRIAVIPERLRNFRSPSRDEDLTPLPASKLFSTLRSAFEWAYSGDIIGELFGWHSPVYMVSRDRLIPVAKIPKSEMLEMQKAEYLERMRLKGAGNKLYGDQIVTEWWKVIMVSNGGVQHDFVSMIESEDAAVEIADLNGWHYVDENGFDWNLDVVRDYRDYERS